MEEPGGELTAPEITADDHVLGPADAPVTVLEYGDYECPDRRGAARDVHRMLDLYPGLVRFVFRNFPIPQLHPHAEQAAEAAEAAGALGKFWEMYELLLRPSSRWISSPSFPTPRAWTWISTGWQGSHRQRLRHENRARRAGGCPERRQCHPEVLRGWRAHRRQVPAGGARRRDPGFGPGRIGRMSRHGAGLGAARVSEDRGAAVQPGRARSGPARRPPRVRPDHSGPLTARAMS